MPQCTSAIFSCEKYVRVLNNISCLTYAFSYASNLFSYTIQIFSDPAITHILAGNTSGVCLIRLLHIFVQATLQGFFV